MHSVCVLVVGWGDFEGDVGWVTLREMWAGVTLREM